MAARELDSLLEVTELQRDMWRARCHTLATMLCEAASRLTDEYTVHSKEEVAAWLDEGLKNPEQWMFKSLYDYSIDPLRQIEISHRIQELE